MLKDFQQVQKTYHNHRLAKNVRDFIHSRKWNIQNAIGFGFGSIGWVYQNEAMYPPVDGKFQNISMYQLAAFLDVIEAIPNKPSSFRIYVQGPLYTDIDKELLAVLGIEVIPFQPVRQVICIPMEGITAENANSLIPPGIHAGPSLQYFNRKTFLWLVGNNPPVQADVVDVTDSELCITNELNWWPFVRNTMYNGDGSVLEPPPNGPDNENDERDFKWAPAIQKFKDSRDSARFTAGETFELCNHAFQGDLFAYWRKED